MLAKRLLSNNQNLKNSDIALYRVFLMHHINVLNRIEENNGHCKKGDESMWLGCNLFEERAVLEDELIDLMILAE